MLNPIIYTLGSLSTIVELYNLKRLLYLLLATIKVLEEVYKYLDYLNLSLVYKDNIELIILFFTILGKENRF